MCPRLFLLACPPYKVFIQQGSEQQFIFQIEFLRFFPSYLGIITPKEEPSC